MCSNIFIPHLIVKGDLRVTHIAFISCWKVLYPNNFHYVTNSSNYQGNLYMALKTIVPL